MLWNAFLASVLGNVVYNILSSGLNINSLLGNLSLGSLTVSRPSPILSQNKPLLLLTVSAIFDFRLLLLVLFQIPFSQMRMNLFLSHLHPHSPLLPFFPFLRRGHHTSSSSMPPCTSACLPSQAASASTVDFASTSRPTSTVSLSFPSLPSFPIVSDSSAPLSSASVPSSASSSADFRTMLLFHDIFNPFHSFPWSCRCRDVLFSSI